MRTYKAIIKINNNHVNQEKWHFLHSSSEPLSKYPILH